MARETHFEIFVSEVTDTFTDQIDSVIKLTEDVRVSNTININLSQEQFSSIFKPYDQLGTFTSGLILDNLKTFFDIKQNYKLFSQSIKAILESKYGNSLYRMNSRKLAKLCKADGGIFNTLFTPYTTNLYPGMTDTYTTITQEIALDFKDMIEQEDVVDPNAFFNGLIPGDCVVVPLRMDLSSVNSTNPNVIIFVKFNVTTSTTQYSYSIDTTS